jgi:5'-nucleotidase
MFMFVSFTNALVFTPLYNLQISVTPLNVHGQVEAEIGAPVSDWLSAVVAEEKEDPSAA